MEDEGAGHREESNGKGEQYADEILTRGPKTQRFQTDNKELSKRVHVLGAGNLGLFVAHSLAGIPSRPPITLLLKRRQLRYFLEHDSTIDVTTRGTTETRRSFEVELLLLPSQTSSTNEVFSQPVGPDLSNRIGTADDIPQAHSLSKPESAPESLGQLENTTVNMLSLDDGNILAEGLSPPIEHGDIRSLEDSAASIQSGAVEQTAANTGLPREESEDRQSQLGSDRILSEPGETGALENNDVILNLIVSVKAPQTVRAVQAVAHRLTHESTILFLQNGMGIIDEVNDEVFPDEKYRPTYIIGVVSHGLYSTRNFSVIHAGEGTIALGVMPRMPMTERKQPEYLTQLAASARYLLRTMTRTPVFVAVGFPPTDLLQQQLDKLAVNCILNPLTALMDCKNGALLSNFSLARVMRLLLAEISLVIKNLPELKNVPNVNVRFDPLRLERLVVSIANSTTGNTSSMLQDLRVGKLTEIDYINGYIVKRGEEMGVHCVMNYMLVHMIKGKRKISQEQADLLPFVAEGQDK